MVDVLVITLFEEMFFTYEKFGLHGAFLKLRKVSIQLNIWLLKLFEVIMEIVEFKKGYENSVDGCEWDESYVLKKLILIGDVRQ